MAGVVKKNFDRRTRYARLRKPAWRSWISVESRRQLDAQPGWRWSECIKPVAGTESCQARHVGAVVGGSMHVVHNDGTEQDIAEGDAYVIEPGHDAWVTSDQPFVAFEFDSTTAGSYAKPTG